MVIKTCATCKYESGWIGDDPCDNCRRNILIDNWAPKEEEEVIQDGN